MNQKIVQTNYDVIPVQIGLINIPNNPDRFRPGQDGIDELAQSIHEHGLQQPIKIAANPNDNTYTLIYGHRRLLACSSLGHTHIPATIITANDETQSALRLIENIQRQNLEPLEEAVAIRRWRETNSYTQEQAAERLGRGLSWLKKREMLLGLADDVMDALHNKQINVSVALELNRIDDPTARQIYVQSAVLHGSTQQNVAHWVSAYETGKANAQIPDLDQMTANFTQQSHQETIPCHACNDRKQIGELTTIFVCYDCSDAIAGAAKSL